MVMLVMKRKGVLVIFRTLGGSKSQYISKTCTKDDHKNNKLFFSRSTRCKMNNFRMEFSEELVGVKSLLLRFKVNARVVVSFSHYIKQSKRKMSGWCDESVTEECFFLSCSLVARAHKINCGKVGCPGFEPQPLHIICNISTNWAKLTRITDPEC